MIYKMSQKYSWSNVETLILIGRPKISCKSLLFFVCQVWGRIDDNQPEIINIYF